MKLNQFFFGAVATLCIAFNSCSAQAVQNPFADSLQQNRFPPVEHVFQLDYSQVDATLRVSFDISDGFYMYQHRFSFSPAEKLSSPLQLPEGEHYSDQFFGDTVIYRDHVELEVYLNAAARNEVLTVHFQGCADDGFCYPPSSKNIFLRRTDGTTVAGENLPEVKEPENIDDTVVRSSAWVWLVLILVVFVGFLLSQRSRKKQ